jgi:hypothetical protein
MHKSATKCNETVGKWCKNKHGASKIIDTLETYQAPSRARPKWFPAALQLFFYFFFVFFIILLKQLQFEF